MLQNFICLHLYFTWEHPIPENTGSLSPTFVDVSHALHCNPDPVMTKHYEWNKFYHAFDAFHPFDTNANLVMEEHYESNKIL